MTPRASQALVNAQIEINRAVFELNRDERDTEEITREALNGQPHIRERRILQLIASAKLDLTEAACLTEEEIDADLLKRAKPNERPDLIQRKERADRMQRKEHGVDRTLRKEWRQP